MVGAEPSTGEAGAGGSQGTAAGAPPAQPLRKRRQGALAQRGPRPARSRPRQGGVPPSDPRAGAGPFERRGGCGTPAHRRRPVRALGTRRRTSPPSRSRPKARWRPSPTARCRSWRSSPSAWRTRPCAPSSTAWSGVDAASAYLRTAGGGRRAAGGGQRALVRFGGRYTARILPKTEADCLGSFVKPLQLLDPLRGWFPFFNTIGGEWAVEGGRKHQAGINQQDKLKPPDSPLETRRNGGLC